MHLLSRLARSRHPYLWLFLFSFLLNAAITALTGIPGPETHDEFSYLLAADTFSHGRLTNPPHPLWQHFESFHILQQPTYQSKYQPGQGLILALGQTLTALPIAGSWLAAALASVAIAWAVRPYLPRRYALVAGLLVASLHPLLLLWSQNYWGGSLTTLGGALVFGAAARLAGKSSAAAAALLAIGITLLFNTRPYEGLAFTLLTVTPLLFRPTWRTPAVVGTVALLLVAAAGWTAYYNYRVTGDPLQLPYLLHEKQYALAPPFLWQHELPPKTYRHDALRQYNEEVELTHFRAQRTPVGFLTGVVEKLLILLKAYGAQPILALTLLGLPYALRRSPARRAAITLLLFLCALFLSNWTFPHYAAPGLVLLIFLATASLRSLAARRRYMLPLFLAIYAATAAWWIFDRTRTYPQSFGRVRQSLVAELLANPGDDLVLVRYAPGRNINTEWVYNPADLDHAPVLFARDMGPDGNRDLLRYFAGRTLWLLHVGPDGARIEPFKPATTLP